jgi:hypothetical protein
MSHITEPTRAIPVVADYDVLVCGAGPAGVAAALAAARAGGKTGLIELHGCLGGIWTAGLLAYFLDVNNKPGIMAEIIGELEKRGARAYDSKGKGTCAFDVEEVKVLLEELCQEAGVDIRLHTRVAQTQVTDGRITHAIIEDKSGRRALAAKTFIDCTGDGDLAALAGCGFDFGHPETGVTQPFSLIMLVAGIDRAAVREFYREGDEPWSGAKERLRQAMAKGGCDPSYGRPSLFPVRDDLFILMSNHEYGFKGICAEDLTAATLKARRELHAQINGLRSQGGVWQNIRIVATPEQIGVREGRRIHGRHTVTVDEMVAGVRHEDAVCRVHFGIDVHSTNPGATKGIEAHKHRTQPYDIPMRALIARDVEGLLMAGRCISGDFLAHSSYRVTGDAAAMGEAAGRYAAKL